MGFLGDRAVLGDAIVYVYSREITTQGHANTIGSAREVA
jgi:hypothetical protein